ncbi:DUF2752 domain-containing protein [Myroides odoratus]
MRIFYRVLLYVLVPLGTLLIVSKGLNYFPIVVTCSIKEYTGWDCPGCGGQRALDALVKGKFKEALLFNPLIYFYLGVLLYMYVLFAESYLLKNKEFMKRFGFSTAFAYIFILLIVFFFIIRNI